MNLRSLLKTSLLLYAGVMLQQSAFAQTDFRKGFIVTPEKDTVYGEVDFHDATKAYERCTFKRTNGGDSKSYTPSELLGYGFVDSRQYLSKTMPKDPKEVVFMELIAHGRINLYRYRETFWIDKQGENFMRLSDDLEDHTRDGNLYRRRSNEYIGVLNMVMFDCSKVKSSIASTNLEQRPLVQLVEAYNRCQEKEVRPDRSDKPWMRVIPGITAGVQQSDMEVKELRYVFNDVLKQTEKAVSPLLGISLDFYSPRITERFVFTTAFWYYTADYYLKTVSTPSTINYVSIHTNSLKIPFGVRYTFAPRVVTPFFNVGLSPTMHFNTSSAWNRETASNKTVTRYDMGEVLLKKGEFGIWGGLGILARLGKTLDACVEVRYERTNGLIDIGLAPEGKSHITNLQLVVGLRLNKAQ